MVNCNAVMLQVTNNRGLLSRSRAFGVLVRTIIGLVEEPKLFESPVVPTCDLDPSMDYVAHPTSTAQLQRSGSTGKN